MIVFYEHQLTSRDTIVELQMGTWFKISNILQVGYTDAVVAHPVFFSIEPTTRMSNGYFYKVT
jgi:hypothetical protein